MLLALGVHLSFGEAGLLFAIGTKGGTQPWANPADAGDVAVRWSSKPTRFDSHLYNDCKEAWFVSRPPEKPGYGQYRSVHTPNRRRSWMALDLGEGRRFALNHYALRNDGFLRPPRSWDLEGADTMEGPWTTLRSHKDDKSLPQKESLLHTLLKTILITNALAEQLSMQSESAHVIRRQVDPCKRAISKGVNKDTVIIWLPHFF